MKRTADVTSCPHERHKVEKKVPTEPSMENQKPSPVENGLKLVGEVVFPGAALLMDGQIAKGLMHTTIALLVGALGPLSVATIISIAVRLNSFTTATTGRGLMRRSGSKHPNVSNGCITAPDTTPARVNES
jgi:hypothetical protein